MARVAPKGRKHLSADALFRLVRSAFDQLPDHRSDDVDIALSEAFMSAFAMFLLKSPSLLAFDQERAERNGGTIYGIERVPCDTRMRAILDPVCPASLRPVFQSVFRPLPRGNGPGTDGVAGGALLAGPRWYGVLFLQDDSGCVVSPQGPAEREPHL